MRYICLLVFLASCATTKTSFKQKTVKDSTVVHELEATKRLLETQREYYETLLADSTGVKIIYQDDNSQHDINDLIGAHSFPLGPNLDTSFHSMPYTGKPTDLVWNGKPATLITTPWTGPSSGKVLISSDGSISAEGRLKSVAVTNSKLMKDISQRDRVIDSFSHLQRRDSIVYRTQTKIVYKEVKRRNWWWLWFLAGFVAGWAARHNWPRVRSIIKQRLPI